MKNNYSCFAVLFSFFWLINAFARPEYAATLGTVNCTACHVSPFGGGVRNVYGKQFAEHNLGNGYTSLQDLASFDLRTVALFPKLPATTTNGLALMTAIPTANIPITKTENKVDSRLITAYGLGGLAPGLRETYVLFNLADESQNSWLKNFTFGKFVAPFGLLTDEHRTYTKLQTRTTENNFEMGGALSGEPSDKFHYDFAVTNGLQSAGAFANQDLPWALIANFRWNPPGMPFFIGTSGEYVRTMTKQYHPYSEAAYTALSLDRLTGNRIKGSIQGEVVLARGWNSNPPNDQLSYFIPTSQSTWLTGIADSQSFGAFLLFNYDLTPRFALVYKMDEFVPDDSFKGDVFVRHAYGFKYILNSNMDLLSRYERSLAKRPGIAYYDSQAARDDFLVMFHLWL